MTVIRIDGGICSQINFVSYGYRLQREGKSVKYDLQWFVDNGKDLDGIQARNWDMPKAFPGLELQSATREEVLAAQRAGRYIGGYPTSGADILGMLDALREKFNPELTALDRRRLQRITSSKSCAVHVRRGDLSTCNSVVYGRPASVQYFVDSIRLINAMDGSGTVFYFFSDDMKWVRDEILGSLDGISFELCEGNGADRGYADLFLMSRCDSVISSGGSLGVTAAILSEKLPRLVISRHRDWVCQEIPRVIYLNDDIGCKVQRWSPEDHAVQYRNRGFYKPLYKIYRHLEKALKIK